MIHYQEASFAGRARRKQQCQFRNLQADDFCCTACCEQISMEAPFACEFTLLDPCIIWLCNSSGISVTLPRHEGEEGSCNDVEADGKFFLE